MNVYASRTLFSLEGDLLVFQTKDGQMEEADRNAFSLLAKCFCHWASVAV